MNVTAPTNSASALARSTLMTIAGQSVGVTQSGTTCTYSLGSSTASVPYGGGSGSVTVTAPGVCTWTTAPDGAAPWLTIAPGASGGTSDVTFTAAPNTAATPRSGTVTVAGLPYTVAQGAAPCAYVLSSSSTSVAAAGASSSFTFSTGTAGCSATALSYSSWLTAGTSNAPDGMSGTVNFTAAANPAGTTRTGTIQFGGQTFTVAQTGAQCAYSLNAYGILFGKTGGGNSVKGSLSALGCVPSVGTDQPSYVLLSPLTGPVLNIFTLPYSLVTFNSTVTTVRRMTITFGGQIYTIKQTSW
ncbi:MAG: BACON domain-containing carbohydrate-binding protein [Candidatus Solibacter sp.]|nr:BACON domain-containing carbohydrate-binding protein [Candidatus Solibacter sp.]